MSDDGLVVVEYTIDGEGKPDGKNFVTTVDEFQWSASEWAGIAEAIAADHYETVGPIGDEVTIAIYHDGKWKACVEVQKYQPIVTYQAVSVAELDSDEED